VPFEGPPLPTDALFGPGGFRGPAYWVGAEYLLYWIKDGPIGVPLATVGPATGSGLLGAPGTQVVLGLQDIDFQTLSGIRLVGGWWLNEAQTVGLEARAFLLPEKPARVGPTVGSDLFPVLARPFFDTTLNRQNSRILSRPGTFAGALAAEATSLFWGADFTAFCQVSQRPGFTIDALAGFQVLSLQESLVINDFSTARGAGLATWNGTSTRNGTTFVQDRFSTANNFYGGVIGGRLNWYVQAFTLSLTGRLGIGGTDEIVRVDGSSTLVGGFPAPATAGGGFFATTTNIGKSTNTEFAVAPEVNLNLTAQVTTHLTVSFGYNFLYISRVVRPGEQLNPRINPTTVVTSQNFGAAFGPREPSVPFAQTDFWAQGLNIGLIYGF
jgi:hypothetical protein